MALAPDATDVAISICSAIYDVGIGVEALLGHQIATKFGLWHIGEAGAILGTLGLASYLYASVKFAEKNKAQRKDAENFSFLPILIKFKAADMDSLKFKLAFGS
ncbi:hypothetical protein [Campylobacter rectus]|uniref:hypothetical protein n=1 Tax=Campylobacter rectus TaxID=203 RepID=UPI00031692DC|nr:hypothetical protein [Campylobacter rectus]